MNVCRSIVSSIVLLVAACGTTSMTEHRTLALRYQEAAILARGRGDATEAARLQALSTKETGAAQTADERTGSYAGGAP